MQKIATFPNFSKLDMGLKNSYNQLYAQYPPYSDFSFGNLVIWLNQFQDLKISLLHDNIVIRCRNLFEDGKEIISILGDNRIDESLDALFSYLKSAGLPPHLDMVPEIVIKSLKDASQYKVQLERDNSNYILSTSLLASLEGSAYGRLRRQMRRFEELHKNNYVIKEIDLTDPQEVQKIVNNIHLWDKIYTHNDQERQESIVINTSLLYAKELGFRNLSLFVDGKVQAITLYQKIPQKQYVIGNHTKANYKYRNAFNFLIHHLALRLNDEGIEFINFEQDLGLSGLREHKLGLRPISFLEHYSVSLLGGKE